MPLNKPQAQREISSLVMPQSGMGFDIYGAFQALGRRRSATADAESQAQKEEERAQLAETDAAIMSDTPSGQITPISEADKAGAETPQAPQAPAGGEDFAEAVVAEGGDTGQVDVDTTEQSALGETQPQQPRVAETWEASGIPGSTTFANPQDAYEYFSSIDSEMAAGSVKAFITGDHKAVEKGVVQTTSPIEFLATGAGSLGMMAMNQSRKAVGKYISSTATRHYGRYMKNFLIGSPAEMGLTIGAEELGEDHPFVGIAAEVLFGVGTGIAVDKLGDAFKPALNDSIEWAIQKRLFDDYSPDMPKPAPPPPPEVTEKWTRAEKNAYFGSYEQAKMKGSQRTPTTPTRLAQKTQVARVARLREKVKTGDLRDPEVRTVVQDAVNHAKQRELKSNQAEAAHVLQAKLDKLSSGQKTEVTNPTAVTASRVIDPETEQIPSVPVPPREDAVATTSEQFDLPTTKSAEGVAVSQRAFVGIRRNVSDDWYGAGMEDFNEDVVDEFNRLLRSAREAGSPITGKAAKELQERVRKSKTVEYEEAIDAEAWERTQMVKDTPWASQTKKDWVRGGSDDEDRWGAPEGGIVSRRVQVVSKGRGALKAPYEGKDAGEVVRTPVAEGDNVSRYKYADWDISDHFVINERGTNLVLRADLPDNAPTPSAPKDYGAPHTYAIDYSAIRDRASVMARIGQRFKYWQSNQVRKFMGKGKRPEFAAVDKLKVSQEFYNPTTEKYQMGQFLPDSEIDAIAKLYGWNDNMITGYHYVEKETGATQNILPEDVVKGRNQFEEREVTSPGWFDKQKKLAHAKDVGEGEEAKSSSFYAISGAITSYRKQREAFLSQVLGIAARNENKRNWKFDHMVESIAVMRNEVLGDIKFLEGSQYGPTAKRTYIAFGDFLAGTDRLGMTQRMSAGEIRRKAMWEYDEFKNGRMTDAEQADQAIAQRMEDGGLSYDEAAAQLSDEAARGSRVGLDAEEAGVAGDVAGVPMGGRVIETGAPDAEVPLRGAGSTDAASTQGISRLVFDMDEDVLNAQVMKLEDHFEVRFADALWNPSSAGGDGKINIWRVNSMDDVNALFMRLDRGITTKTDAGTANGTIKSLAQPIDPKVKFGLRPAQEHSADMVQRLSMVMDDTQKQMVSLASRITENPSDASTVLAWNKLRVVNNLMSEVMTQARPTEASLDAFKELNFNGSSNAELLERVMGATNKTMPLGADGMPNPGMLAMQAEMFAEMPNSMRRSGLLARIAKMQGDELNSLYQGQRRLASILQEACGK